MDLRLVIFDMDGTLADTSPGILESYRYVADALGRPRPDDEEMYSRMGGSLHENIARIYDLEGEDVQRAVDAYREFYGREGFLMSVLYPGMPELLDSLRERGIMLSVATMKVQEYAELQVEHWGLQGMFQSVNGSDALGTLSKTDMIDRALYSADVSPEEAVMVGDTTNDLLGAKNSGVPFVGVTYGYGLTEGMCEGLGVPHADSPAGILRLFFP